MEREIAQLKAAIIEHGVLATEQKGEKIVVSVFSLSCGRAEVCREIQSFYFATFLLSVLDVQLDGPDTH